MIVCGSAAHAAQRRRHLSLPDGFSYHKSEWLETSQQPGLSPTIFLVEQPPHSVLASHFHKQNEFQLVVQGGGQFGRHPVSAVSVHYAGAFTGYGPIVAGPEGISYFTIRATYEAGAMMLPAQRDALPPGPRRQLYGQAIRPFDENALATLRLASEQSIIERQDDGVESWLMLLPPGANALSRGASGGVGQFLIVLAGSLLHGGRTLTRWESLFVTADEPPILLQAGERGLQLLTLQIPARAHEFDDAPH